MPKPAAFSSDFLKLTFNATAIANLASNTATAPATNITVALHTADPTTTAGAGTVGLQTASEAAYAGYARVNVVRTTGGWTVTTGAAPANSSSVVPLAAITFPQSSAAGTTITHFSVGTGTANYMLYSGTVTPNVAIGATGITPQLTVATTISET